MSEAKTSTLDVPGAVLTYDIRRSDASGRPALLLVGSPMGAAGFGALAAGFADRTVLTYDPRGSERSRRTDGAAESTPEEHADDLSRLITALDAGPADVFASSGGAVNALALVARRPDQVRTLVAHEPPVVREVPDHAAALAACRAIRDVYLRRGMGPAMALFIGLVSLDGPIPAGFGAGPAPDPTVFGLPTEDDGTRDDPLLGQNMVTCTHFRPDYAALRAAATRIVIGVGAASATMLPGRTATAVAARLGPPPRTFPGDHAGFIGPDQGGAGDPVAFAGALRQVLDG